MEIPKSLARVQGHWFPGPILQWLAEIQCNGYGHTEISWVFRGNAEIKMYICSHYYTPAHSSTLTRYLKNVPRSPLNSSLMDTVNTATVAVAAAPLYTTLYSVVLYQFRDPASRSVGVQSCVMEEIRSDYSNTFHSGLVATYRSSYPLYLCKLQVATLFTYG